ncbi:mannose-1-phosphate guanylyltransferase/mannose-6-phosphate isomerase [Betaproteobacteria bacterium GR16-43]|nr:mannose-1-phosphate guanylyltransferase/mannose-6-phosphate isomerase [Betaproteobacteria bacterium GR16-43]
MSDPNHPLRAVILAGGSGTRLWPLSRSRSPKQFMRIAGEESLLEATAARVKSFTPADNVLVVTSADSASGEGFRILEPYPKLLEPVGRNTAPAIGAAAIHFRLQGLDPILLVLPSDHLIRDVQAFGACLDVAIAAAARGDLVTFGIRPTSPATGYGYIQSDPEGGNLRRVARFVEKPDAATAVRFLSEGGYLWNSGMFVWKASAILAEIERALPDLHALLLEIEAAAATEGLQAAMQARFARAPSISIDHGVLQGSDRVHVVPATFDWSDVGSWDSVHDVADKDDNQNSVHGNVVAIDCRNTFVRSDSRLVAAIGVEDLAIIETPDAILVTQRGQSQRVREVVDELTRRNAEERHTHLTVQRPWGSYTVLQSGPGYKLKRIEVRPGGRLSLQSHAFRSEHWVVVSGVATVTVDGREATLQRNESTFVPLGSRHRLENRETVPLQIIEVQVGDRVDEDDITRYEDVYGRLKA